VSTEQAAGLSTDATIRQLLLLMPRLVGRAKRLGVPDSLQSLELAPRHLSLLSYLLFDGPLTVSELAERLQVAPTTVSLLVSELAGKGVLTRRADDADRRRRIIDITSGHRSAIEQWLAPGARAWQRALEPLSPAQRATFITTLRAYEQAISEADSGRPPTASGAEP
jgi:DNA-binding MarR family transcriptional regulator